ncbi:MAG: TIGR04255 family protein [Bacteroidaceae bacterium]|jgi:uncharacterized protein (TIGR04255 family)|nr:TIGR04255 family protein [Bacteroidaceae bacterium]
MAVSGNLHTIQDNHAIKEVVLSFTITPQIVNPNQYAALLNEGEPLYNRYHKFEPVKLREVKVETGLNATTYDSIKDAGFKMIAFRNGCTSEVIQGLSQPRKSLLTFNTVNYEGWQKFSNDSIDAAKIIAEFQPIYTVQAFSLMFIDEFYFKNDTDYKPHLLFNLESRNLPKGIADSDFVDYNFNLHRHYENKNFLENVSIKVFNEEGKKSIRITENITFVISPTPLVSILKDSDLRIYLDFIHDENKKTLKDILAPEISNIIKL